MSVYKPAKGRYWHFDFQIGGRRFHGSTGQTTRRRALEVEQARRLAAAKGEAHRPDVPTLDQATQRWWEEKGQYLRSADDVDERLAVMVQLVGRGRLINEIGSDEVARAIQRRRGMLVRGKKVPANATVNRCIIDTLRPILRRAKRVWKVPGVQEIDWAELRLPEAPARARDYSDAEIEAVIAALRPWWREFAAFEARYGLRLSEMFFHPSAVDPRGQRVLIRREDRKGQGLDHVVPLLPEDAAMLAARKGRAEAAGLATVWYREGKGRPVALTYRGALSALRQAMTDTGLREAKGARGSHDLRHHSAMRFLRATGNLRATQRLLGHKSIQSTLVYAHALEGDVRAGLVAVSRPSPEPAEQVERKDEVKQAAKG